MLTIHNMSENKKNVLLNPNWFYDHKFTPIISYLKNETFQNECKDFKDEFDNNLLHYFFMNISNFDQNTFLLLKWCIQIGINFNSPNKKNMTPFYYYVNFLFENNFSKDTGFEKYIMEILNIFDKKTVHSDGNNFIHILCHSPYLYNYIDLMKEIINKNEENLKEKNSQKQIPLQIAMSFWRKTESKKLLYYLYLKTPEYCLDFFDAKGRNSFHLACEYDLVNLVDYMLNKNSNFTSIKLLNEEKTPIIFVILKNANLDLIIYFLNRNPDLFLEKNDCGLGVLDILFQMYVLEKNEKYKKILYKIAENHELLSKIENAKHIIQKFKKYDLFGDYECQICLEKKDLREWEIPFSCCNHNEKIHLSCMKKWYDISKSCPICDYKIISNEYEQQ
jgi:ankyrin repeat protein